VILEEIRLVELEELKKGGHSRREGKGVKAKRGRPYNNITGNEKQKVPNITEF